MTALSFLIAIAPLLLLVALLALNLYPGEAAIERLRLLIERVLARPAGSPARTDDPVLGERIVRGGGLIACSLAGRAPPVPA